MTPYRDPYEDDWEDDGETDLGDDQDSDDEPTIPCPYCRRDILEDTPRCPSCERYISEEDHLGPRKPLWIIATALVLLGIVIWWAFGASNGPSAGRRSHTSISKAGPTGPWARRWKKPFSSTGPDVRGTRRHPVR